METLCRLSYWGLRQRNRSYPNIGVLSNRPPPDRSERGCSNPPSALQAGPIALHLPPGHRRIHGQRQRLVGGPLGLRQAQSPPEARGSRCTGSAPVPGTRRPRTAASARMRPGPGGRSRAPARRTAGRCARAGSTPGSDAAATFRSDRPPRPAGAVSRRTGLAHGPCSEHQQAVPLSQLGAAAPCRPGAEAVHGHDGRGPGVSASATAAGSMQ